MPVIPIGSEQVNVPDWVWRGYMAMDGYKAYREAYQWIAAKQASMGIARSSASSAGLATQAAQSQQTYTQDQIASDAREAIAARKAFFNPVTNPGSVRSAQQEAKAERYQFFGINPETARQPALSAYNPLDIANQTVKRFYTPEGSYMQQELKDIKLGASESGELGYYEKLPRNEAGAQRMAVNPETGRLEPFILFGGAGRNAGQSGMFTFAAATPAVYGRGEVQRGAAGLITPAVSAPELAERGLSGIEVFNIVQGGNAGQYDIRDYLSRLGAEAYGGVVGFTDARTLGGITYEDRGNRAAWNMAAYLDPLAVNRGKADLPGANIPWSVGENTPAIFFMDRYTRSGESSPAFRVSSEMPAYFPQYGVRNDFTGLGGSTYQAAQNIVLSGSAISYGDIKAYPEAENLGKNGRLVGSGFVAGCAKIQQNWGAASPGGIATPGAAAAPASWEEARASFTPAQQAPGDYWFRSTARAIASLPFLGDVYRLGAAVPAENAEAIRGWSTSAPVLSDVAFGGEVFAAMKEYERSGSDASIDRYKALAGRLVGRAPNEDMKTHWLGSPLIGVGKSYRMGIAEPIEGMFGPGVIRSAVAGVVESPGMMFETAGMGIIGGERTVKNAMHFPALAAAGGAMTADAAIQDPVKFGAGLAATYGIFRIGGAVTQKGIGLARTRGMEYVPLENIGYGPEGRYPLNPAQSGRMLAESFRDGVLYPEPTSMAEGGPVPYLHGRGGHPAARLPNTQPGDITMWTALESSSRTRGVPVGEGYTLRTSGGSEVPGMYGAPILESYFLKAGNQPQMIGFDLPFKTPTAYSTIVSGLESVPRAIRRTTTGGNWDLVSQYITRRSQAVPAGQAYMPLIKAEYEAVIPDFTNLEITGRNYYTKVGGFGKSHFLGTRIPIVEQRAVGFDVAGSKAAGTTPTSRTIPDYYRPPARIGGYSLMAASGFSMGYGLSARSGIPSTRIPSKGYSSPARSGGTSAILGESKPFSGSSARPRTSSSSRAASSGVFSRSYSPVEEYISSINKGSSTGPRSSRISGRGSSRPYSGGDYLYTPGSPPFTPGSGSTTRPRPGIPGTPWTPAGFPFGGAPGGGGSRAGYTPRKRWAATNLIPSLEHMAMFGKRFTSRKQTRRKRRKRGK